MLTQAGFTFEFVNMTNRHRACQYIIIHVVFKTRKEKLEQMRCGLESVFLIQFLQINHSCIKYVFPLQNEAKVHLSTFLRKIDSTWFRNLDGVHKTVVEWFKQYVTEVDQSDSGILIPVIFNFGFSENIEISHFN